MTKTEPVQTLKKSLSWLAMTVILINFGLFSLAALALSYFGSFSPALAYLQGDRLIADVYSRSFGTIRGGEETSITFKLTNTSSRPIKILGAMSSCTCVVVDQLPATLAPKKSLRIQIGFRSRSRSGHIVERVQLFTNQETQQRLNLEIRGNVIDDAEPSRAKSRASRESKS